MVSRDFYYYNRLVLIGNGFDLSLNLPTSYEQFLIHLLKKSIIETNETGRIVNPVFTLLGKSDFPKLNSLQIREINENSKIPKLVQEMSLNFELKRTPFFNHLISTKNHWTDIEQLYFELLKIEFHKFKQSDYFARSTNAIYLLNSQLNYLRQELKKYLEEIDANHDFNWDNFDVKKFETVLTSHLPYDEFVLKHGRNISFDSSIRKELKFINFNYTPFLKNLLNQTNINGNNILHIHGALKDPDNEIIFGYGDDMNEDYRNMELANDNTILEHFKSFHYSLGNNYSDLQNTIESAPFEVFIYGHSCGLSDRTLLKTIFEHDNCKAIKILHRGSKESHRKIAMNISRHFDDKIKMRKRIIDFSPSATIEQLKPEKTEL